MSSTIQKFKLFIRFIVSIFASREFGFVYCIIGTLAQTAHTYFLVNSVSSLEGFWKYFQAFGLSIFISSSLLFFTAIADNDEDSPDYRKIHLAVNLFMIIEIIINLYYYAAHLIINTNGTGSEWLTFEYRNIFNFIFAILISCMIPVTIKLYAGIIQAKEWFESFETDEVKINQTNIDSEEIKNIVKQEFENNQKNIIEIVSEKVNNNFNQNAEQFLKNIESRINKIQSQNNQYQNNSKRDIEIIPIENTHQVDSNQQQNNSNIQKDSNQVQNDSEDLMNEFQ